MKEQIVLDAVEVVELDDAVPPLGVTRSAAARVALGDVVLDRPAQPIAAAR
jgi:hypothetical protein